MGECILSRVSGGSGKKMLVNTPGSMYAYSNSTITKSTLFQYANATTTAYVRTIKTEWTEVAHLVSSASNAVVAFALRYETGSPVTTFYTNQIDIEGVIDWNWANVKYWMYKIEKNANGLIGFYMKLTDECPSSELYVYYTAGSGHNYGFENFFMAPLN